MDPVTIVSITQELMPKWVKLALRAQGLIVLFVTGFCAVVAFVVVPKMDRKTSSPVPTVQLQRDYDSKMTVSERYGDDSASFAVGLAYSLCDKGKAQEAKDVLDYARLRETSGVLRQIVATKLSSACVPKEYVNEIPDYIKMSNAPMGESVVR